VVKGRALPDVCDGQKPVQRRILYSMSRMGLGFGGQQWQHRRQARLKAPAWWAMCWAASTRTATRPPMTHWCAWRKTSAQRYPLIDGQGNFGSRDGDGAAAMRYTEARLAKITSLLLDEIDMGTVDFQPNYDGSTEEPQPVAGPPALCSLLNGASGIAVGLATEIPSHNLREVADACVALIKNPTLADDALPAGARPRLPGWRADHQQRVRHCRRLPHRPRFTQGARSLEN
jgi:topoisomerase-4 subunit A